MIRPASPPRAQNPAAQAGLLLIRLGIMILAFCTPMSAIISRRLIFTLVPVGAVLIIFGSLLAGEDNFRARIRDQLTTPFVYISLAIMGWTALSLLWTPMAGAASEHWLKMFGTAGIAGLACACLPTHTKISNLNILPISIAITAIVILTLGFALPLEAPDPAGSTLQRAAILLALAGWPAMAALAVRQRWALVGALAIALVFAVIAVWSGVLLLASAGGAAAFALSRYRPLIAAQILGWAFAGLLVLAPALPIFFLITPFQHDATNILAPFIFWGDIIQIDGPRLITGHGFDAVIRGLSIGLPLDHAPNSIIFELWYELGVVGAVLGAVLIRSAFALIDRFTHPCAEPFALACVTHILILMVLGITLAQLWFLTTLALTIILLAVLAKGQYQIVRPRLPQR
jgi:hypothetical protein